ncbi:MAG: hypothetical protein AAF581_08690 [Planctomycetota bacterium]
MATTARSVGMFSVALLAWVLTAGVACAGPAPTRFNCYPGPCDGGGILLTWTSNAQYAQLSLVRDDGAGSVVTIPVDAAATEYHDLSAAMFTVYQYRLDYVCTGSSIVESGPLCATVAAQQTPFIYETYCDVDFCANEVQLEWDAAGVVFDSVMIYRDGTLLATVPGDQTTYLDTSPLPGNTWYMLEVSCGGLAPTYGFCMSSVVLDVPRSFTGDADQANGGIDLLWWNAHPQATLELRRNGALLVPQPVPGDYAYHDPDPGPGCHTYELTFSCLGSSSVSTCVAAEFDAAKSYLMIAERWFETVSLYDPECGAYVGKLIAPDLSGIDSYLDWPMNVVAGPDGFIYVTDYALDEIHRYDYQGNYVGEFGAIAVMTNPQGLTVRANGNVLVATVGAVREFTTAGVPLQYFLSETAVDVHAVGDGTVLVSIPSAGEVRLYNSTGTTFITLVSGLDHPSWIVSVPSGDFAVLDAQGNTVTVFTLGGAILETIATPNSVNSLYPLANGEWLYTTHGSVWSFDPVTGISTDLYTRSSGAPIEVRPVVAGVPFERGDCNGDGGTDIADPVWLLSLLFPENCTPGVDCPEAACGDACDSNDDSTINLADAIAMLTVLFPQGCTVGVDCTTYPAPAGSCGDDVTSDLQGCDTYLACP